MGKLNFRVTDEQEKFIRMEAQKKGFDSVSDYIRTIILNRTVAIPEHEKRLYQVATTTYALLEQHIINEYEEGDFSSIKEEALEKGKEMAKIADMLIEG